MVQVRVNKPKPATLNIEAGDSISSQDVIAKSNLVIIDEDGNKITQDAEIGRGLFDGGFTPKENLLNIDIPVEIFGVIVSTIVLSVNLEEGDVSIDDLSNTEKETLKTVVSSKKTFSFPSLEIELNNKKIKSIDIFEIDSKGNKSTILNQYIKTKVINDSLFIEENEKFDNPVKSFLLDIKYEYIEPIVVKDERITEEKDFIKESVKYSELKTFDEIDTPIVDDIEDVIADNIEDVATQGKKLKNKKPKKEKKAKKVKEQKEKPVKEKKPGKMKGVLIYLGVLITLLGAGAGGVFFYRSQGLSEIKTTIETVEKKQADAKKLINSKELTASDIETLSKLLNNSASELEKVKSKNFFALEERNKLSEINNKLVDEALQKTKQ